MEYILRLRSSNKDLREHELISVLESEGITYHLRHLQSTFYKLHTNKSLTQKIIEKTAYTSRALDLIKTLNTESLEKELKELKYEFKGSFSVKAKDFCNKGYTSQKLAPFLWYKSQDKKVDLENADNKFFLIIKENYSYLCRLIIENNKNFLTRMPSNRPYNSPFTLKSDLARACVNFLSLKKGKVVDYFCGLGGLLLEAYDLGMEPIGVEISRRNLFYTEGNFKHFFNYKPCLFHADSNYQIFENESIDGIVTDIPYGKSTRIEGKDLYKNFIKNAHEALKENHKIVVICSNYFDIEPLISERFKIEKKIEEYINRSMKRYIIIGKKTDT